MNSEQRAELLRYTMGAMAEYSRRAFGEDDDLLAVEPDEEELLRASIADEIIDRLLTTRAAPEPGAIERAANVIAEMYPPRESKRDGYVKPVWDMADIEDLAECALQAAARKGDQP